MMKNSLILVCIFVASLYCSSQPTIQPLERTVVMMDTFVQISIFDQNRPIQQLESIMDLTFKRMAEIEHIANDYDDSSFISFINREAGYRSIALDTVLYDIITASEPINKLSDGAFDITIGTVRRLWSFNPDDPRIPGDSLLKQQLHWVGMKHIKIMDRQIQFDSPDVKVDLGGIAKGYAVDQAINILKKNGITDAMVNAGGNLRAICSHLTRGKRRVWIKHPRLPDQLYGFFPMDEGSVATSGDYERFFLNDSVRYHHLLDPKTGYPTHDCVSVTILAPTATEADGLSTAVFILGPDRGLDLITRLPYVEGLVIFETNGKLNWRASTELKKKFKQIS